MNVLCSRSQAYLLLPQSELNFKLNCLINFKEVMGIMTAAEWEKKHSAKQSVFHLFYYSLYSFVATKKGKRKSSISIKHSLFCFPIDCSKQQYPEENKNQAKAEKVMCASV